MSTISIADAPVQSPEKPRGASPPTTADPFLEEVIALLPALRAFGLGLCGDASRVDDLAQDTLLKAHLHRTQFRADTNLRSWLFTILRNCYFSEQRRRKFEIEDPECTYAAHLSVDPIHDATLQLQELNHAMQRLPPAQREALLLVCADGVPYAEAAETFGVAIGTIKSRIARARGELSRWRGSRCVPTSENPRLASMPSHQGLASCAASSSGTLERHEARGEA